MVAPAGGEGGAPVKLTRRATATIAYCLVAATAVLARGDADGGKPRGDVGSPVPGVAALVLRRSLPDDPYQGTKIETTSAAGVVNTTEFRYQGDAIVEERANGVVTRQYLVDSDGSSVEMIIPAGQPEAGTYLVGWNGHGDALNLRRIEADGTTTLANSFTYDSWGRPTTTIHNGIADLGFRFLYVVQQDVQWDDQLGLGLEYMHSRHYPPALGRFLQPDPSATEDSRTSRTHQTARSVGPMRTDSVLTESGRATPPFVHVASR